MYSFPDLEPACYSMCSSNCCFLICIQISQEAGQVVWYSHLLKNFPQFVMTHTVKGFGIVNKAEIDVFLELSCIQMGISFLFSFAFCFSSFLSYFKASSDNHFAFLHFFFLGMVSIPVSYTMSRTSVHSSSGTLSVYQI